MGEQDPSGKGVDQQAEQAEQAATPPAVTGKKNGRQPKKPRRGIPDWIHVDQLRQFFGIPYWLFVVLVLVGWAVIGFRVVGSYGSRIEAINQVGLTTIILCLLLWLGDAVGYLKLTKGLAAAIWVAFVSSVLTTGAVVVKATFLTGDSVAVETVVPLDQDRVAWKPNPPSGELAPVLTDLAIKQNAFYRPKSPEDFFAVFAIVVTGAKPSASGAYKINGNLTLLNMQTGLADTFGTIPTATTETPWRERNLTKELVANAVLPAKLDEVAPGPEGRIVLINSIRDVKSGLWLGTDGKLLAEGNYKLTVDIYDGVSRTHDRKELQFVIKFN